MSSRSFVSVPKTPPEPHPHQLLSGPIYKGPFNARIVIGRQKLRPQKHHREEAAPYPGQGRIECKRIPADIASDQNSVHVVEGAVATGFPLPPSSRRMLYSNSVTRGRIESVPSWLDAQDAISDPLFVVSVISKSRDDTGGLTPIHRRITRDLREGTGAPIHWPDKTAQWPSRKVIAAPEDCLSRRTSRSISGVDEAGHYLENHSFARLESP